LPSQRAVAHPPLTADRALRFCWCFSALMGKLYVANEKKAGLEPSSLIGSFLVDGPCVYSPFVIAVFGHTAQPNYIAIILGWAERHKVFGTAFRA